MLSSFLTKAKLNIMFCVFSSSVEDLLNDEDDLEDDYNIDNDQEEKLLRDDGTDICENQLSENELDESEDVLNLEVEDELEEDEEGIVYRCSCFVSCVCLGCIVKCSYLLIIIVDFDILRIWVLSIVNRFIFLLGICLEQQYGVNFLCLEFYSEHNYFLNL